LDFPLLKAYALTYITFLFLFLILSFQSISFLSRTFFLEFVGSPFLKIKIGFQTPTTNLSLYYVIRHNQVEKFVFVLQKKTHIIIPFPIALGKNCLPIPRRKKKIQTTIPISLGQMCLPIPSRHKNIQTKIPIRLRQIYVQSQEDTRRYKQQFQLHLDKFLFQFQEDTRICKQQFQLH
jgi:hypothetical protein